jgi:hypothetical protein
VGKGFGTQGALKRVVKEGTRAREMKVVPQHKPQLRNTPQVFHLKKPNPQKSPPSQVS